MCENVVVLSYKPRTDIPTLIKKKVILIHVISIPAQKKAFQYKHTPDGTDVLMWRLLTLQQSVCTLGIIWTSPGGIKSLDKATQFHFAESLLQL